MIDIKISYIKPYIEYLFPQTYIHVSNYFIQWFSLFCLKYLNHLNSNFLQLQTQPVLIKTQFVPSLVHDFWYKLVKTFVVNRKALKIGNKIYDKIIKTLSIYGTKSFVFIRLNSK